MKKKNRTKASEKEFEKRRKKKIKQFVKMVCEAEGLKVPFVLFEYIPLSKKGFVGGYYCDIRIKGVIVFNKYILDKNYARFVKFPRTDTILHEIAHIKYITHTDYFFNFHEYLMKKYGKKLKSK